MREQELEDAKRGDRKMSATMEKHHSNSNTHKNKTRNEQT